MTDATVQIYQQDAQQTAAKRESERASGVTSACDRRLLLQPVYFTCAGQTEAKVKSDTQTINTTNKCKSG